MTGMSVEMSKQDEVLEQQPGGAARRGTSSLGMAVLIAVAVYAVSARYFAAPIIVGLCVLAGLAVWGTVSFLFSRSAVAALSEREQKRRRRSIAVAWGLAALMVMFYVATFVQFGGK